jgi:hypothetical protein
MSYGFGTRYAYLFQGRRAKAVGKSVKPDEEEKPTTHVFRGAIAALGLSLLAMPAMADPPVDGGPRNDPIPQVFCFRITDVEQVIGFDDRFNFEFEVLNWTATPAAGLALMRTVGATTTEGVAPFIAAASVDPDGRGGPPGGADIGSGVADAPEMQSGRGNHAFDNDWTVAGSSATAVSWSGGTAIPNRDLIGASAPGGILPSDLVPIAGGLTDDTGDTAVDGGAGTSSAAFGAEVLGSGNVLDGFVLTIDDFDVGERVAFNWFLLDDTLPIGTAAGGNAFGFGTIGLMRGPGDMGPMFVGNSGFGGGQVDFFGNVGAALQH